MIAVSGGNPYHLLAEAQRTGFGLRVRAALGRRRDLRRLQRRGDPRQGPTLAPITLTSPFPPPPDLDLTGLALTDVLVLPHHNREGRAERHAAAQAVFGNRVPLAPLRDGEYLIRA